MHPISGSGEISGSSGGVRGVVTDLGFAASTLRFFKYSMKAVSSGKCNLLTDNIGQWRKY